MNPRGPLCGTFLNLLWIVLPLLLLVGGCAMAVDQSLDI